MRLKSPPQKKKLASHFREADANTQPLAVWAEIENFRRARTKQQILRAAMNVTHTAACWAINGAAAILYAGAIAFSAFGGGNV